MHFKCLAIVFYWTTKLPLLLVKDIKWDYETCHKQQFSVRISSPSL